MRKGAVLLAVALAWASAAAAAPVAPLGERPAYLQGAPGLPPNASAIDRTIWAPDLDRGYVPQGLAWGGGALYLSAYRSDDPKVGTGPCRLFRIDPESGDTLGRFDLPAACGHAGGLAWLGGGVLLVSDTRRLYRIDAAAAFGPAGGPRAVTASVALEGSLKGSFASFDGKALFVGTYSRDTETAKGFFLAPSVLDAPAGASLDETAALRAIALPAHAQGAVFDRAGRLWISAGGSRFGRLCRLDVTDGEAAVCYATAAGVEGLAFDDRGRLWAVSEAGSLRWRNWPATFPLLFRLDPDRLR